MLRERSAGAVLFFQDKGKPEYLILHYPAGHWDFPKGNVEQGEDEEETVRREIKEETGIKNIKVLPVFKREIEYYYRKDEYMVRKQVVFYIAEANTGRVKLSQEHLGYVWLPYNQAYLKVTFRNAKDVLDEAHKFLQSVGSEPSRLTKNRCLNRRLKRINDTPPYDQKV